MLKIAQGEGGAGEVGAAAVECRDGIFEGRSLGIAIIDRAAMPPMINFFISVDIMSVEQYGWFFTSAYLASSGLIVTLISFWPL